jgi:hypothetical protein
MTSVTAYPLTLVLDGRVLHVIWMEDPAGYANDTVLMQDASLVVADSDEELREIARAHGLRLAADEGASVDLDSVARALDQGDECDPDPVLTLNAWNIFGDIARSVGAPFDDRSGELDGLYDKVFAANNLPAMTPPGERYEPAWSRSERRLLRSLLTAGLSVVRSAIPPRQPENPADRN